MTEGGGASGPSSGDRFRRAVELIDAANADDPNRLVVRGRERPKELAHAELMTEWIERLAPDADDALRLAARAHHVRRWQWPRSDYPEGRAGYLRWRRDLYGRHADLAAALLTDAGYDSATIERTGRIIRKKGPRSDPDVQAYEDALCIVFIETQLADLARRTDREKMIDIVARTIEKMSPDGRAHALAMPLGEDERGIVQVSLERVGPLT